MIKSCVALFLLLLPAIAFADRIILAPSAYSLSSGFDTQVLQTVQYKPRTLSYIDAGTSTVQLEAAYLARPGADRVAVSVQGLVLPETFITPAVSIGIRDIGNSAGMYEADGFYGRGYYLVVTKGLDNSLNPPKIHEVTLTGGIGAGSFHGLFGGVSAGLPLSLLGTVEYDSRQMNYRVAMPIGKLARLSYNRLGGTNFVGIELHSSVAM
jgi:hypothetical protein